jgi:hypothetical protein
MLSELLYFPDKSGMGAPNTIVQMTPPQVKKVGLAMTMTPHSHVLLGEASRFAAARRIFCLESD